MVAFRVSMHPRMRRRWLVLRDLFPSRPMPPPLRGRPPAAQGPIDPATSPAGSRGPKVCARASFPARSHPEARRAGIPQSRESARGSRRLLQR